jgi:hypothetical protein
MTKNKESIDDQISEMFIVLGQQKEAVERSKREINRGWVTNGSLQITGLQPINILTASEETLVFAVAQILMQESFAIMAAEELGLKHNHKISGYNHSAWIEDCKKRIASIQIIGQKAKLAALEARLNSIISPEQRRELELNAIRKELGDA